MYSDGGLGHHSEVPTHVSSGAHASSSAAAGSQIPQLSKASGSMSARGARDPAVVHAKSGSSAGAQGGATVKSPTSKTAPHAEAAALNGASQRRPSGDKGECFYLYLCLLHNCLLCCTPLVSWRSILHPTRTRTRTFCVRLLLVC